MAKYLDPRVDFLFKRIFGGHKELLISFLNSLLPLQEGQEIVTIDYLTPEQVPDNPLGKNSIVDVRCIDNFGRAFIVEMQSEWSNMFMKRLLVNGAKAIVRQLDKEYPTDKAKRFQDLKPVYVLAVINNSFTKSKNWYHLIHLTNEEVPKLQIKGLDYILLELPKFVPETWTYTDKKLAVLWLRFLKEIEGYHEKLPEDFISNEYIRSAVEICKESAFSPKELADYERSKEQAQWDDSIKGLEDEVEESRKIIEENKKALEENKKALEEKDKALEEQHKKMIVEKLEIAKNLLNANIPINIIIESTGLTKEEIEKLKKPPLKNKI